MGPGGQEWDRKLLFSWVLVLGSAYAGWGGNCQAGSLAAYMSRRYSCTVGL
jgi:hypothetical protein